MKEGQGYPLGFTNALTESFNNNKEKIDSLVHQNYECSSSDSDYERMNAFEWSDCELDELVSEARQLWTDKGPGCPV